MRPHPRTRKAAKWLLTAIALPLAAATTASFWYGASLTYSDPADSVRGSLEVSHGVLRWSRFWGRARAIPGGTWAFGRLTDPPPPWTWRWYDPGPAGKHVFLPLWAPASLAAIPAAVLWLRDLRMTNRSRIGHCTACGYDRKGLAPTAPCPECGAAPSAP